MGLSTMQVSADATLDLDIPAPATAGVEAEAENQNQQQQQQQKRPLLKCPRCDSSNTKFCYYNNYSRLQPRHFCRACKRHWTAGGTLRNVPVGGGRKNKRAKTGHNGSNNSTNSSNQQQQQQQQQVSVPFSAAEIDSPIFPDIFRQVMFQPQPQLPETTENLFSAVCNSTNSSSSPYGFKGHELAISNEESMLGLTDGWLQETSLTQSASSYWNCWDGMMGFDASGINLSAPNASL